MTDESQPLSAPGSPHIPTIIAWTLIVLIAAYAVAISPAAMAHNADSLIPIYVSLEAWRLFYWGQDRFGMLTALVALPVRDSFANLIVQNMFNVVLLFAGLAAAFARVGLARPQVPALLSLAILVVCGQPFVFLLLTTNQSYAPSLGCFGLALYFCRDLTGSLTRTAVNMAMALVLMMIGAWTNGGVALLVLFLAAPAVLIRVWRWMAIQIAALAIASIVFHRVLQALVADRTTYLLLPTPGEIPGLLVNFWTRMEGLGAPFFWIVTLALWAAALWLASGPRAKEMRLGLLAIAASSIAYGCLMAVMFKGRSRYFAPVLPIVLACPIAVLGASLPSFARIVTSPATAAAAFLLVAVMGLRLPGTARRELVAHLGEGRAEQLRAQGVDAITGEYWKAWETVFATNLLHEAETGQRPVLPVLERSEPMRARQLARLRPGALVAVVPGTDMAYWRSRPDLPPLQLGAPSGELAVARVVTSQAEAAASPGVPR